MKKIGRPRVPKSRAKAVLIGARFAPSEAKQIESAADSHQDKSKWIRDTLLWAANEKATEHYKGVYFNCHKDDESKTLYIVLAMKRLSDDETVGAILNSRLTRHDVGAFTYQGLSYKGVVINLAKPL